MSAEKQSATVGRSRYLRAGLVIFAGPVGTVVLAYFATWLAIKRGMHPEEVPWVGFRILLLGIPVSIAGLIGGVVIAVRTFRARAQLRSRNS